MTEAVLAGALARLAELRAAIDAAEAESVAEAGLEALADAINAADARLRQLRKRRDALEAEMGEVTAERRARTAERDEKVVGWSRSTCRSLRSPRRPGSPSPGSGTCSAETSRRVRTDHRPRRTGPPARGAGELT